MKNENLNRFMALGREMDTLKDELNETFELFLDRSEEKEYDSITIDMIENEMANLKKYIQYANQYFKNK